MLRYIEHMKTRPVHHQKAVALGVSGSITLVIFAIWAFVTVNKPTTIATDENQNNLAAVIGSQDNTTTDNSNQGSPVDNFTQGIQDSYNSMKSGVDLSGSYQNARTEGLNNGQQ